MMERWKPGYGRVAALRTAVASAALATVASAPAAQADPPGQPPGKDRSTDVQLLNITDQHGALVPGNATLNDSEGTQHVVSGGAYLAAHFDRPSEGRENSYRFTTGDSSAGNVTRRTARLAS